MSPATNIKRVGMLFSGGPAPAANAVISAAAISFLNSGIEVIGFYDGYENLENYSEGHPLVEGRHFIRLTRDDVSAIRNRKDIILRTSRANPGKPVGQRDDLADDRRNQKLRNVYAALEAYEIDALVSIGGDDTLKTANYLKELQNVVADLRPIRIVHLPKTIDNDYYGIDWTFGFFSAAHFAASEIRNLGADARSTQVWYVLEIMGRKAGWLTYASGIAGEATKMISVEDYDDTFDARIEAEGLVDLMQRRESDGRRYGIICIAEGLADHLPDDLRPQTTDEHGNLKLGDAQVGRVLAREMERVYLERTGHHDQGAREADRLRGALRRAECLRRAARHAARRGRVPCARGEGSHRGHGERGGPALPQVRAVRPAHRRRDDEDESAFHRP